MSDYQDINNLNPTPTALITGADKVPFYNTSDAKAYAMTMDQLQTWVLAGGTIDPTFDDVSADTVTITGTTGNTLVVDTNTLVVDATNNRVGVGTASPAVPLDVIGVVKSASSFVVGDASGNYSGTLTNADDTSKSITFNADPGNVGASSFMRWNVDGTERMRLDSAGNLGLGVTPSAWGAGFTAMQYAGGAVWSSNIFQGMNQNAFYTGTNWIYRTTAAATNYEQTAGIHRWYNAASGTAGNSITFTQAMTLDASGNLGIGTVSPVSRIDSRSAVSALTSANAFRTLPLTICDSTALAANTGGGINFEAVYTTGGSFISIAAIRAGRDVATTADFRGYLSLLVGNNITGYPVEAVRLKSGGQLRFVPLASAPTTNVEDGDVYYDSGTNKLRVRAGGAWVDLH